MLLRVEEVLHDALIGGAAGLGGLLVVEVTFHPVVCGEELGFSLSALLDGGCCTVFKELHAVALTTTDSLYLHMYNPVNIHKVLSPEGHSASRKLQGEGRGFLLA